MQAQNDHSAPPCLTSLSLSSTTSTSSSSASDVFTGGFSSLSGVGLYHWPSFFNHSPRPNVSRYAIGDVMFFVTNQDVAQGHELCISYIEHDVLCEGAKRRNAMLSMNFNDANEDELLRLLQQQQEADDKKKKKHKTSNQNENKEEDDIDIENDDDNSAGTSGSWGPTLASEGLTGHNHMEEFFQTGNTFVNDNF